MINGKKEKRWKEGLHLPNIPTTRDFQIFNGSFWLLISQLSSFLLSMNLYIQIH